jgi:hypothetical protein
LRLGQSRETQEQSEHENQETCSAPATRDQLRDHHSIARHSVQLSIASPGCFQSPARTFCSKHTMSLAVCTAMASP